MRERAAIGILREEKTPWERRAPLTPDDIRALRREHPLEFVVQPSPNRVFPDAAYREAGARVDEDLSGCRLVLGIKEVPAGNLLPGMAYLFFSHTIKGQAYNMPLLRRILELGCTLMDYELVRDGGGNRLIAFGFQAGQAGMINSLWSYGRRMAALGVRTPLAALKQAIRYENGLEEAREALRDAGGRIRAEGLPPAAAPLIVAVTGEGRVAAGAQDVLAELQPVELEPDTLLQPGALERLAPDRVYKVVFEMRHFLRPNDPGKPFDMQEYFEYPERYHSRFERFLPFISLMVNGIYWDPRYPKLVSRGALRTLFSGEERPRLTVIGDVTCDVEGSVEATLKATTPDNPVFVYHPESESLTDGFEGRGLLVMAVDILPSEIPEVSSRHFSTMLKGFLPALARVDFARPLERLALPPEFASSVIAHRGALAEEYGYLEHFLADAPAGPQDESTGNQPLPPSSGIRPDKEG